MVDVPGCEPYESTYDVAFERIRRLDACEGLLEFAKALEAYSPRTSLLAFDRLLDGRIDSEMLYALFVAFRACLCKIARDQKRALCTPVRAVARDAGFPLHADLFPREKLFIVFDDVSPADGGASLFLGVRMLLALLEKTESCPPRVRRRVRTLLCSRLHQDGFDELYELLHGCGNPWVPDLECRMAEKQIVFRFRRGQGYLIDDRRWLHGRRASEIPVTSRRFRRLVF